MRYTSLWIPVLVASVAGGCASTKPDQPPQQVQELSQLTYPADAAWTGDLDIVVVRHDDRIQLVNRTAHTYDGVILWLNQQYARPLQHIAIGTDNYADLRQAVDKHRRAYPVGGFFEPDKSARLVQVELVNPATNERYRLTVAPTGRSLSKYGSTSTSRSGGGPGNY